MAIRLTGWRQQPEVVPWPMIEENNCCSTEIQLTQVADSIFCQWFCSPSAQETPYSAEARPGRLLIPSVCAEPLNYKLPSPVAASMITINQLCEDNWTEVITAKPSKINIPIQRSKWVLSEKSKWDGWDWNVGLGGECQGGINCDETRSSQAKVQIPSNKHR